VFNLACFQSALHRPLLAPIYGLPGLEDRVGSDTDYKYRHTVITRIRLSLQLGLAQRASGVLNQRALLAISLSVAPEILPELQIQVESLIFKSSTWSILCLLQIFDLVFRLIFHDNLLARGFDEQA
jgi:hypothetical protein